MTDSENFCLRLNGFEENTRIYWQELQTKKDLYDVTLACDTKQIKTHKLVISSCSPVLKNILKLNQSPHPIIYLTRVRYRNLQNLLDFMYQGETNVAEDDLSTFLQLAEDLNVRGLCERNRDNFSFGKEGPAEYTHQMIGTSPKSKRTSKTEKIDRFNETKSRNYSDNFINKFSSEKEELSQFTNQKISPSPKRKRTSGIGKIDNFNDQKTKSGNASENFINSHTDNQTLLTSKDEKNEISVVAIPDEGGSYSCGQCDFKTKFIHALKPHIESVHEGVRYPCHQCSYKAAYKQDLQKHVKSIHDKESHPCSLVIS